MQIADHPHGYIRRGDHGTILATSTRRYGTCPGPVTAQPASTLDVRITGLDGLRGFMTLMVVISHFFAELPHGISAFGFGFFGVIGFFALSGFLIGRLILEKKDHKNFLAVFYVRRFCRMIPPFFLVLAIILGLYALFGHHHWSDVDVAFPWWSYVLFIQNFFMVSANSIGGHWLAPTWTLAVEEHFYLIVPAALLFTPRRHLLKGLIAVGVASLLFASAFLVSAWPITSRAVSCCRLSPIRWSAG